MSTQLELNFSSGIGCLTNRGTRDQFYDNPDDKHFLHLEGEHASDVAEQMQPQFEFEELQASKKINFYRISGGADEIKKHRRHLIGFINENTYRVEVKVFEDTAAYHARLAVAQGDGFGLPNSGFFNHNGIPGFAFKTGSGPGWYPVFVENNGEEVLGFHLEFFDEYEVDGHQHHDTHDWELDPETILGDVSNMNNPDDLLSLNLGNDPWTQKVFYYDSEEFPDYIAELQFQRHP